MCTAEHVLKITIKQLLLASRSDNITDDTKRNFVSVVSFDKTMPQSRTNMTTKVLGQMCRDFEKTRTDSEYGRNLLELPVYYWQAKMSSLMKKMMMIM